MPGSTSIPNPHTLREVSKVTAHIDQTIYEYFFRYVCPGIRGVQQSLIATFFDRFHSACLAAQIAKVYDPDNESALAAVLNRLNFDPRPAAPAKPARRSPRGRRTDPSPTVAD